MFEIGNTKTFFNYRGFIELVVGEDLDNLFLCEYFHLLSDYSPTKEITFNRILFYTQPELNVSGLKRRWWEDVICSR